MPDFDAAQQADLARRTATNAHVFLWLSGKNRSSGTVETLGLWTGDDHQQFTIDGQSRLYYGAGTIINVAPVRAGVGLKVQHHRISLPPVIPEIREALRGYEMRQAGAELHVWPFTEANRPIGPARRMVKGTLAEAPESLGADGSDSKITLVIASAARRLTFGLPLVKSNAALKERDPNDRGREYSDIAGEWTVPWGEG